MSAETKPLTHAERLAVDVSTKRNSLGLSLREVARQSGVQNHATIGRVERMQGTVNYESGKLLEIWATTERPR